MALVKPNTYRAARDFTFQGVNYPKGAPISTVLINTMPHLSSLLSRGYIQPDPDPHQRRGRWRNQPMHIPGAMLRATAGNRESEEEQTEEGEPNG